MFFLDAAPPQGQVTWLNFAILLVTLASMVFQHFTSKSAKKDRKQMAHEIVKVSDKTDVVSLKTDNLIRSNNGPLGAALLDNAINAERIANMTKNPDDILAAVEARRRSSNHIKEQAEILAAKVRDDENKQKVIDTFLKEQQERQTDRQERKDFC